MSFSELTKSALFRFSTNRPVVFVFSLLIMLVLLFGFLSYILLCISTYFPDRITKGYNDSFTAAIIASSAAISTAAVVIFGFVLDICYRYRFDQDAKEKNLTSTRSAFSVALIELIDICDRCALRIYHSNDNNNLFIDMDMLLLSSSSEKAIFSAIREANEEIADDIRKLPIYHRIAISKLKDFCDEIARQNHGHSDKIIEEWKYSQVAVWICLSAISRSYIPYAMGEKSNFEIEDARRIFESQFLVSRLDDEDDYNDIFYEAIKSASQNLSSFTNNSNFAFLDPNYIKIFVNSKVFKRRKGVKEFRIKG